MAFHNHKCFSKISLSFFHNHSPDWKLKCLICLIFNFSSNPCDPWPQKVGDFKNIPHCWKTAPKSRAPRWLLVTHFATNGKLCESGYGYWPSFVKADLKTVDVPNNHGSKHRTTIPIPMRLPSLATLLKVSHEISFAKSLAVLTSWRSPDLPKDLVIK